MSHDKIKSITINENQGTVFVTHASSNVFPRTFQRTQCQSLEKILQEQGRDALDAAILKEFKNGMFQGGNTIYAQTGKIYGEHTLENLNKLRKLKKETRGKKFVIVCATGYIGQFTKRGATVCASKHNAKQMDYLTAMSKAKNFNNVDVIPA